jgi:hypothetical protein
MPDLISLPRQFLSRGFQKVLNLLDSGYRIESGTGPDGMTLE